jgi:drug/metabolite transporter (DMT)-like permease
MAEETKQNPAVKSKPANRSFLLGMLLTLAAACLWGSTYPVIKIDLQYYSPYDVSFLRAFFASLSLLAYFLIAKKRFLFIPRDRKLFLLLLSSSFFGATGFWTLLNLGVLFVDPDISSFLVATYPLIAIVFASLFLKERMTPAKALGVVLGIIGTFVIVGFGQGAILVGSNPVLGEIFSILAAFSWAGYMVTTKKLMGRMDSRTGMVLDAEYVTFTTFAIAIIPTIIISALDSLSSLDIVQPVGLGMAIYLGVLTSAFAFVIFNTGMKWIGMSRAAVNQLIFPGVAVLSSYALLGELINFEEVGGIVLIILGILIAQLLSKE